MLCKRRIKSRVKAARMMQTKYKLIKAKFRLLSCLMNRDVLPQKNDSVWFRVVISHDSAMTL